MLKELIPVVILCVRKARYNNLTSGCVGCENCKSVIFVRYLYGTDQVLTQEAKWYDGQLPGRF